MAATSHVGRGERVARPRKMRDYEAWVDAMLPLDQAEAGVHEGYTTTTAKQSAPATEATTNVVMNVIDGVDTRNDEESRAEALLERLMLGLRTSVSFEGHLAFLFYLYETFQEL
jgi:hypothetical protein